MGEIANIDGLAVMLVDTPGVRETSDEIEREAIARGRTQVGRADLVVLVIDPTRDLAEQRQLLRAFTGAIHVVNKSDQPRAWEVPGDAGWIETVATTGEGVDRLRDAIKCYFFRPDELELDRPRWWTQRQREILERAMNDPGALLGI